MFSGQNVGEPVILRRALYFIPAFIFLISSFFLLDAHAALPISPVPQTGQTLCYDSVGATIACASTGQDGELQIGVVCPNPRFVDNGDQTQTDKLTGLIWSKDANPAAGTKNWSGALYYIKTLNSSNYLGHNDWRLPNINELASLVNKGQSNSATWLNTQGFSNVQSDYYWSGSTHANDTSSAWGVNVNHGLSYGNKPTYSYVWPVRSGLSGSFGSLTLPKTGQTTSYATGDDGNMQIGATWPDPRFAANADQTVTDKLTGLIWSKEGKTPGPVACGSGTSKNWQEALDYVKCLNRHSYLGKSDWRLPNSNELASLVNRGQANLATWLNTQGFSNVNSSSYWSGSTYAGNTSIAWDVYMDDGFVSAIFNKTNYGSGYVWPVRSGQYWSFDSLALSATPQFGTLPVGAAQTARQVEIGNRGTASQSISSITLSGAKASEFSIASGGSNPCPTGSFTQAAPESCTLMLGFLPANIGVKSASLDITANGTTNSITLTGTAISTVYGVVTDQSTGLGVSGATVTLNTSATTTTNTDGSYTFGDLPTNSYSITVSKTGYQTTSNSGLVVISTASAKTDILLPTVGTLNITSTTLPWGSPNVSYNNRILVAGGTVPYTFSKPYGYLPTGLSLDTTTGIISGTPTGSGNSTFAIGVTDNVAGYGEKEFTIELFPPLQITTASLPSGQQGVAYSSIISATGGKPAYSFSTGGTLPDGMTLSSTGTLSGIPIQTASFIIILKLKDSAGVTIEKSHNLNLTPADALTFNTVSLPEGKAGVYYTTTLSASGGVLSRNFSVTGTLPSGLTLNSTTGILSGTPRESGTFNIELKLTDSIGVVANASYTLILTANALTLNTTTLPEGYIGTSYTTTLSASGGVPARTFSVTGTLPTGLSFNSTTGKISGTPSVAGLTNLTFTVTDYSYPTAQTVNVTLPLRIWNAFSVTTTTIPDGTQKTTYSANLTGIGGAAPHSWSIAIGVLPQGITLDGTSGTIAGTPANCGAFPFTARLTDSATAPKSVDRSLSLNIACSNDYTISGNAGVAGATISYSGTASGAVTADGSGNYSIGPLLNGTYTVTPSKPLYVFTPALRSVTVSNLDYSVVAFVAVEDATAPTLTLSTLSDGAITKNATLNISGTVSDTNGVASLTINNGTVTITNGTFSHAATLQAGPNTITTVATDTLGNKTTDIRTITLDTTATTQTTLKTGWNLMGWTTNVGYYQGTTAPPTTEHTSSTTMSGMTMSDMFGTLGLPSTDSFVVVGPDGVVYMPGSPFNTLKKALPGKAYWIYTPSDKTITVPGTALLPTDQLPLNSGWTQIAYWGTDGVAPATGFACINGKYDILVDESGKVYMSGSPFNTLKTLQKNKGYFIHTTVPATLTYQCQ
jgi:hypothetical protein